MSHNSTRIELDMYSVPEKDGDTVKEQERLTNFLAFARDVIKEDILVCLDVQDNLENGVYQQGQLSNQMENGVQFFQKVIKCVVYTD